MEYSTCLSSYQIEAAVVGEEEMVGVVIWGVEEIEVLWNHSPACTVK